MQLKKTPPSGGMWSIPIFTGKLVSMIYTREEDIQVDLCYRNIEK